MGALSEACRTAQKERLALQQILDSRVRAMVHDVLGELEDADGQEGWASAAKVCGWGWGCEREREGARG